MKKNPEVTDATRNKFIQAFCELYRTKPISKITIKEITDLAGYNRSTFYQYFKDVYELLEYMENEMITIGLEKILSFELEAPDFNQQFVVSLTQVLKEHENYSIILLRNGAGSAFYQKILEHVVPFLRERYQISEENTKAVYILEFCLTGMLTMMTHWLKEKDGLTVEELGSLVQGIWCDGLLAQLKE
ncbi:MAG: TetR/AcrR family transcriptional regulator [Lachnospiraceae bacterium]|nr:TetR/AcrR family transcriptional regulator [Lachnospiraceae bacterium]